jgi:TetR/AcrR family transcriptional regulator, tetracycline repressor protein
VARPEVRLISRLKALEAALHIVDAEWLATLSIRQTSYAVRMSAVSRYHRFRNQDEILVAVTRLALTDVVTRRADGESGRV